MYVGKHHAGETWSCVLGEQSDTQIDAEGWADFSTLDGRLSVYLPEQATHALEHDCILRRIVRETAEDTEEMRL